MHQKRDQNGTQGDGVRLLLASMGSCDQASTQGTPYPVVSRQQDEDRNRNYSLFSDECQFCALLEYCEDLVQACFATKVTSARSESK